MLLVVSAGYSQTNLADVSYSVDIMGDTIVKNQVSCQKQKRPAIAGRFCLIINVFSVTQGYNIHHQFGVINIIDYAVITYTNAVTVSAF